MNMDNRKAVKPASELSALTASANINLIVSPVQIQPTSTVGIPQPSLGVPIMREGFVTDTGFLPQREGDRLWTILPEAPIIDRA
jgi:hypothetical protein